RSLSRMKAVRGAQSQRIRWSDLRPMDIRSSYHSTTGIVHAAVTEKLPYDWLRDLAPVSLVTTFAPVMIVSPTLPVKDLREFIALLKSNPGRYNFASSGTGTPGHGAGEWSGRKRASTSSPFPIAAPPLPCPIC